MGNDRVELAAPYWIGIDTGGTFTDVVVGGSDGSCATRKVPSTSDDYGRAMLSAVLDILDTLKLAPAQVERVVHGTTVATNAILERKGAKTALVTTKGFRDVLELRRIRIPVLYNLAYEKPPPLVPRRLRFEVTERLSSEGEVLEPLDSGSVEAVIDGIRAAGVEAAAVCLLHSYVNPDHEHLVKEMLSQALPDVIVSCSADVLPEIREYERTSTTVINAYVAPKVRRYLGSILNKLEASGVAAPLLVMQSNGGVMTAQSAMEHPAHIIESGPAAGVIAAAQLARAVGHPNLITFDMGGTTAKASMIEDGNVVQSSEYEVGGGINLSSQLVKGGGYALKLPVVDVSEIGAGGGSIVWIDKGGSLRVGPQSAGAMPGPACYGHGGVSPTVTDANVVLGYLNPKGLAGETVPLHAELAVRALKEGVSGPLDLSLHTAAMGVYEIAVATMMRALKAVSTYRGRDPRDCALLAFGGNGPVFAAAVARSLQMTHAIIPPAAGVFSAFGLLLANVERQLVQTHFRPLGALRCDELNRAFAELERRATAALARDGWPAEKITLRRFADLRYAGQAYELLVPVASNSLQPPDIDELAEAFEREHLRTYGHRAVTDTVDLVNLRVTARTTPERSTGLLTMTSCQAERTAARSESRTRPAYFGNDQVPQETPVISRAELGRRQSGPLIIEEYDATCIVPVGCTASLDEFGNIIIEVGS